MRGKTMVFVFLALVGFEWGLASVVLAPTGARGATPPRRQRNVGDLQERLEVGLRPRHPDDFAFLKRVVDAVKNDQLPLQTVQVTFNWARRRRPYPFPYFQRAVKLQAAKRGVTLR